MNNIFELEKLMQFEQDAMNKKLVHKWKFTETTDATHKTTKPKSEEVNYPTRCCAA